MKKIAVFISGNGGNLQALIDATRRGALPVEIALVVSNRKDAYGLVRAQAAGIPTLYFPLKPYTDSGRSRAAYDADLAAQMIPYGMDLIVLAGWMHIFTPAFMTTIKTRAINLHPALPGQFPGAHAIQDQFEAYTRGEIIEGGCMVHDVIAELDAGPVVGQTMVPFLPDDTLEAFSARLHAAEHRLLVACVGQVVGV